MTAFRYGTSVLLALLVAGAAMLAPPASATVTLGYENYQMRDTSPGGPPEDDVCLDEDDQLAWYAAGDLAPSESFTFSPAKYDCHINGIYSPRRIFGSYSAQGSRSDVHVTVQAICDPDYQFPCAPGSTISTPIDQGKGRYLTGDWCLWTGDESGTASGVHDWQITVRNDGAGIARNVAMYGYDHHWPPC